MTGTEKSSILPKDSFATVSEFQYFLDKKLVTGVEGPMLSIPIFLNCAPEELPQLASGRDCLAEVERITPDIFSLRIGLRTRSALGYLVSYTNYWAIHLFPHITVTNPSDLATRWLRHMFPRITPAYVTYLQMIDLIESLHKVEGSTTAIQDYFCRSTTEDETIKRWPKNIPFSKETVKRQAKKDDAIVDAVKFLFSSPNVKFRAKVGRRGLITFYGGSYSEFHRLIVPEMVGLAKSNLDRLHERRRERIDGNVSLEPVTIAPEVNLTKADLTRLRTAIERHYMTAVLYGGNPWLMLSLIDKSDGSTLDLHAYEDQIIITPVVWVSAASLTRLYGIMEEALPLKMPQFA